MASRTSRSPQRTRERILSAALAEFSARGFSGARVDAIARRARINKRMLYHYFGNKEALYRAILGIKMAEKIRMRDADPADPQDALAYWFEAAYSDVSWTRLLQWEALDVGEGAVSAEAERAQGMAGAVARVRARQDSGLVSNELDAEALFLMCIALSTFPVAFPQAARLVMGLGPSSPAFRRRWTKFLRGVADHLRPRARERKGSAA